MVKILKLIKFSFNTEQGLKETRATIYKKQLQNCITSVVTSASFRVQPNL